MSWQTRLDNDLKINTTKRDWATYALAWAIIAALAAVATWALIGIQGVTP